MMFLVRTAFWLMILILIMPTDAQQRNQIFGTAEATVKDVSGFCERNPSVCEKGKSAFDVFMQKAQFGMSMIVSLVQDGTASEGTATLPADPQVAPAVATPDAESAEPAPAEKGASLPWVPAGTASQSDGSDGPQNTLSASDLAPAWKGPGNSGS